MAHKFDSYAKHTSAPKIKYTGIIDFNKVYSAILSVYSQKAYLTTEKKNIQKAGGGGVEIEVELYGFRNETEYVQFEITALLHAWDLSETEVIVDGEKKTLQRGRIMIDFEAEMKTDWQGEFEKTSFLKKMRQVYDTKLMAPDLYVLYADKMYYEMYKFHAAVKEALDSFAAYNAY